jgi:predicted AlkP superfamily pyrophosphatase or phosphodiesterase
LYYNLILMKPVLAFFICLLLYSGVFAQTSSVQRPRLVVGIVIDQMRWDYLYRYYERYSEGGFRRLMNRGFNCQNTVINYIPTYTAPGHASIYTGSIPGIHGIIANDWIENQTGEHVYCTEDKLAKAVGGTKKNGSMSPANLLTTTITDELRLATNMRAKVFSFSLKDRSGILPGGHTANGAYWFDDSTGSFMSSTYYGAELPGWLTAFNNRRYADTFVNSQWETLYPISTYTQSTADNAPYEGLFSDEKAPVFPHKLKSDNYSRLRYAPAGNTILFKAAKACIKTEDLGQRTETDFLCLSFSAPDYAGHKYGPNSIEIEDMYLRLDKELAAFLDYLDDKIGEGNYTIFLTADHGAAHNARYLQDIGIPAGGVSEDTMLKKINECILGHSTENAGIKNFLNGQIYMPVDKTVAYDHERINRKMRLFECLKNQPEIEYAIDLEEENHNATVPEPIRTMILNSYNPQRSGNIQLILNPGWYDIAGTTGTTHGAWNPYDSHIPLLWYGWGIPKGETHRTVYNTDIAATLAALLHIQTPNGCVGNVITEIVK